MNPGPVRLPRFAFVDLTGRTVAGAVVLERGRNDDGNATWHVRASCGHVTIVTGTRLRYLAKRGQRYRCRDCAARGASW